MDSRPAGLLIVAAGAVLILIGLAVIAGGFGWFGRMPGDIRIERGGTRIYMPIGSMIVVSIVLSLLLSLLRRFF